MTIRKGEMRAMELKIGHSIMYVKFEEGMFQGMTVEFHGEWCADKTFGVSSWSGKITEPIERKLTDDELEYVKTSVLTHCETLQAEALKKGEFDNRKVKFSKR